MGEHGSLTGTQKRTKKPGVKWDEANLEDNEIIKSQLQPIKIREPKTPYHGPTPTEDEDEFGADMAPLTLEAEEHHVSFCGNNGDAGRVQHGAAMDFDSGPSPTGSHSAWDDSPKGYSSGSDAERKVERRRSFEMQRKQHYKSAEGPLAKEALRRRKELEQEAEEAIQKEAEGAASATPTGMQL